MELSKNINFTELTTLRVGGPARFLVRVRNREELFEALTWAKKHHLFWLLLGGGSNLIPTDAGFDGLVIQLCNRQLDFDRDRLTVTAGAGVSMAELVRETTERGWAGLEWAGGLPGTLGGAVRGNAGAFGGEIKDSVLSVTTIDPESGQERQWESDACQFAYRSSIFKTRYFSGTNQIIWEVKLRFDKGNPQVLQRMVQEKITYRQKRHPQEPSAGSIFQNLWVRDLPADFFDRFPVLRQHVRGEKLPTGALLEAAGMKGQTAGGARISDKHANIIINAGGATATEVRLLRDRMRQAALDQFGIELKEEPEFLR